MRTVYLGTSEFAVEVLRALAASEHSPELVVTPPDRPKGRGRQLQSPGVARASRELGIQLLQTNSVNGPDAVSAIERAEPEAFAVCQFGQLIAEPLLSMRPMLNVHPSLLPRWRGAAPIERALMAGDARTGVTIFQIVEELDAGPVAAQEERAVEPDDTYGTLAPRLAELGGRLLVEALDGVASDRLQLSPQPERGITYADKIGPIDRRLDPAQPSIELDRRVRALTPHIGAFLALDHGERLGVARAAVSDEEAPKGKLYNFDGRLLLGCAAGTLELLEVKPAGKRMMAAADYLRGHPEPPALAA